MGKTDALEIGAYPASYLQVLAEAAVALTYDVEISNVDRDDAYEAVVGGTNIAITKGFALTQGAAFVRVNVKTLTGGKAGVIWNGALQS